MVRKRKPIIHVVKRKNLPKRVLNIPNASGFHRGKDIWLVKEESDIEDKEHEKYHFRKRHPDKPKNPKVYMRNELLANKYTQEKVHLPKSIDYKIVPIVKDISDRYKIPVSKSLRIMKSEVKKKDIPVKFKRDYNKAVKKYYKGNPPKDLMI